MWSPPLHAVWNARIAWVALCAMALALCAGCEGRGQAAARPEAARPLRPLVYTELPELTPRAAAVRERRLKRELIHGSSEGAAWGRLERAQDLPPPHDEEALGRLLFEALMERDEGRWGHAFVSPRSWAALVHVEHEQARAFVDELQADSLATWRLFDIERASEAPQGGLGAVFEFQGLELGQGRTVSGELAEDDEVVSQHWGNVLRLGLRADEQVSFELRVPKILRVVDRRKDPTGQPTLAVASPIEASRSLEMFTSAGIHLKPELLRSQEYPLPLAVGNFWRYRRRIKGQAAPERVRPAVVGAARAAAGR